MHRLSTRAIACFGLPLLFVVNPMAAQLCPPAFDPGVDNRDGYLPPFEEQPVRPMALSSERDTLWVVDIPDAKVSIFDATDPTAIRGLKLLDEIAVGLGPVTIQPRPRDDSQAPEMWVVCTSSNSVFVIDENSGNVLTTIRVEDEPADLVFDASGKTAYVSLSASNQIAVIDTNTRSVSTRIEFDSNLPTTSSTRLHAEEPIALMIEGDRLYGLSNISGNGTMANPPLCDEPTIPGICGVVQPPVPGNCIPCFPNIVPGMAQQWDIYNANPSGPEPSDRDVLRFDVNSPGGAGTVVGWRFGTLNFDLEREPGGSNLVVSNMEMRNDRVLTEQLYPKDIVELGKPTIHRISMGPDDTAATSNLSVSHFDLNDPANINGALASLGYRCAFPTQMAFNKAGDRLYVACYGSDNVAVLDYPPTQVLAELRSNTSVNNPVGFGTFGVLLDEARSVVYTYEQGDSTVQVYANNPATGTVNAPLQPTPNAIGFNITPPNVIAGRFHFNNTANSAFGTEACASCHLLGHADGLAWNLSDLSGDIPSQIGQPLPSIDRFFLRDNKDLKVTMSLRGIEETPPFHWRGDRDDLAAFNEAQEGLLGGSILSPAQVQELDDFIFSLSYRPNPEQPFDRVYSAQALDGAGCFNNPLSLTFRIDDVSPTPGTMDLSCQQCHSLAGFSGTVNQITNDSGGVVAPGDVTQLRGMNDKLSDQYDYPTLGQEPIFPVLGWGFANSGAIDTFNQFVEVAGGGLGGPAQIAAVQEFFKQFDTGMAPTTAYAWTMSQASIGSNPLNPNIPSEAIILVGSAFLGHNDVIVRGRFNPGSGWQDISMYQLGSLYYTDTLSLGPYTANDLIGFAAAGNAVLTFIGTPVGLGYRLGIDRDMDFVFDRDESMSCPAPPTVCSSHRNPDTDGDSFPDGYEIRLLTNPNDPASVPTTMDDSQEPTAVNPAVAWFNSNVMKVRWLTNEESISRVIVREGGNVVATAEDLTYKWQHSEIVRGLIPGRTYQIEVETRDPLNNGNTFPVTTGIVNMQPRLFQTTMHVESTALQIMNPGSSGPVQLQATFEIHDGATSAPLINTAVTVDFEWYEWIPGGTGAVTANPVNFSGTTDGQGRIQTTFSTVNVVAGQGGIAEVISRDVNESVAFRMLFPVESGLLGFGTKINLP
ncbi:MAG: hypothetical protein AAF560_21605 [Acidobacteriota bacterium]